MQVLEAVHPLEQLQPLLVQQVVLPQPADRVLQAQEFLQVSAVALLQHFDFLLELSNNHLQLLLTQAALVIAVQVRDGKTRAKRSHDYMWSFD